MILAGLIGAYGVVGFMVFDWLIATLVVLLSFSLSRISTGFGVSLILRMHRTRLLYNKELPELQCLSALQFGQGRNRDAQACSLFVRYAQCFALDGGPGGQVVAFSSVLVRMLDRGEMAGVLAHELAHLKHGDIEFDVSAGLLVQLTSSLAQFAGLFADFLVLSGRWSADGLQTFAVLFTVFLAPTVARLLQAALSRQRE